MNRPDTSAFYRGILRYRDPLVRFCRDIIRIKSFSCQEGPLVRRILAEMRKVGFEKAWSDRMGNVIGQIGRGPKKVMIDAHIDTVGVGDPAAWRWDPFGATMRNGAIYGRGATDQKAAMASMVYAARLIRDFRLLDGYTLWVVGSVQEEDCDGLPLLHLIQKEGLRPDCVVLTEPTNLRLHRGHRGRMEIVVRTKGRSCHASMPQFGDNAVVKMTPIIQEIDRLNRRLKNHPFLGKGTVVVSKVECKTPSVNAVPDECTIYLDRRLTVGETKGLALRQVRSLPAVRKARARVFLDQYRAVSWKGLKVSQEKYFPTWLTPEGHPLVKAGLAAGRAALGRPPAVSRWIFSTNGVGPAGRLGIPCIGFGPGDETLAHSVREKIEVEQLLRAAIFYAAIGPALTGRLSPSL